MHSFYMSLSWGGGLAPQGVVGEEPDAHYHAQPGGLHGASHLRTEHEPHGRPGETPAHYCFILKRKKDLYWLLLVFSNGCSINNDASIIINTTTITD